MSFKRFEDDTDGSELQAETRLQIRDQFHKAYPKPTLLAQGATMIWAHTRWWEKILMIFFLALMLVIPLLTNWMNVQMVQGSEGSSLAFAVIFAILNMKERILELFRGHFLLRIATRLQTIFLRFGFQHYESLSKPSRLSNPANKFIKFLQEASWSLNHLVEWGLISTGSMIGQSMSAVILLFLFDLQWIDYIVLPIAIGIAVCVIRKLQKILTERQQKSREIDDEITSLEQFMAMKLQNGDIRANDIEEFLLKSIQYDNNFVRPMYNYIGYTLEIALGFVIIAYAFYLPNDRVFVAKLVLINTISSALNSVTHFMSQYDRYCNQYLKYRKHFNQELTYDEHHEALQIPEEGLFITNVSIPRGENYSIQGGNIPIIPGSHILVQGPSGAGKTSFFDGLLGFIPGVSLSSGVPGNYSHQICVHAQSCSSLVQMTSISFANLFGTNSPHNFELIHELFCIVFEQSELKRILDNISLEDPFQMKIEGKLSGGQQARIFIALTLWNLEKRSSKIAIFDEIESALDPGNRVTVLQKLYAHLKARNISAIWITHMCQCELDKCGIEFDGGKLFLAPREDGTGADILQSE